jgi:hypothetical protein
VAAGTLPTDGASFTTTAPVRRASNCDASSGSNGSCTITRIFCSRIVHLDGDVELLVGGLNRREVDLAVALGRVGIA